MRLQDPPFCPFYCRTADDPATIIAQLKKRGVLGVRYLDFGGRWCLWRIPGDQVQKLPFDIGYEDRDYSSPYYLPVEDDSGHSIYPIHPVVLAEDEAKGRWRHAT